MRVRLALQAQVCLYSVTGMSGTRAFKYGDGVSARPSQPMGDGGARPQNFEFEDDDTVDGDPSRNGNLWSILKLSMT